MQYLAADAALRARRVRLVIFDVDGVLTDGRLWYGPKGDVMKVFHAFDGHGIKLLQQAGLVIAILSGRRSPAVTARAKELGIKHVLQGIDDKRSAFEKMLKKLRLAADAAAYMGDDLVDLPVLERCGFACAPREAPRDVRAKVHAVPTAAAGLGAVREVCDYILQAQAG
ncbi:MAG TPA: HAD-IIIA family hydrolase [Burkholderiales bacterium]|nr:HAD-IIIA family hydrolase [Burkholderiales bacterium]